MLVSFGSIQPHATVFPRRSSRSFFARSIVSSVRATRSFAASGRPTAAPIVVVESRHGVVYGMSG